MFSALKALFENDCGDSTEQREHRVQLAVAALLVETARADFTQDAAEQAAMAARLRDDLGLTETEISSLLEDASERLDESVSLYEFTRVINDYCDAAEKLALIDNMWAVAYADGAVDKYEEHLIRQVAELTYVPHPDYIKSKLKMQAQADA